jgi:hypothetical protein
MGQNPRVGRRVAVVVAAGVGDKPRGDAAERIANGLSVFEGYDPPVQHAEWFEVPAVGLQPVDRFETGHAGAEVDIYEFWWADLSRFPAASRSFLAAFFGLFLALPSFGRTALRKTGEIGLQPQGPPPGPWTSNVDYHLLGFLSWIVAVPIVVLSAQLLITVAALAIAITLPEASVSGAVALGVFGVATAAVGVLLLRRYRIMSGRRGGFVLGLVALAGTTAVCVTRVVQRGAGGKSIELALADTVTVLVAYPMRILWLAVLALAAVIVLVLGAKLVRRSRDHGARRLVAGRTVTAVLTVGFGPFGFALLIAILSAAVGGIAQKIGPTVVWAPADAGKTPLCLERPDSWTLIHCPDGSAWQFGNVTLGEAIFALVCALAVVLVVLVVYLAIQVVGEIARRVHPGQAHTPPARQAARISLALNTLRGTPAAVVLAVAALVGALFAAAAWLPIPGLLEGVKSQIGVMHGAVKPGWAPRIAAVVGTIVSGLLIAARAIGITPQQLAADKTASNILRLILDKPYDIATFLREPVGAGRAHLMELKEMPRQKMLGRYRALLDFLGRRGYDRVVFAAHSQGTVLTATLLHERQLPLPASVSLLTFGCPLRQLYSERFPSQYAWVKHPDQVRAFVPHVSDAWVNVGNAGDPIGRTVFEDVPVPWLDGSSATEPGRPHLEDLRLGTGGHSSYWSDPRLYARLARLIEA